MSTLVPLGAQSLEHYDPDKGLKTIAIAEALEIHYRRAKDATRLLEAIELKLSEQRRFVLWYDSLKLHGGARPNSGGARPGAGRKKKSARLQTGDLADSAEGSA